MTDMPIDDAQLVGGSPQDRRRLLERMHEYLDINARFDWVPLQDLWSPMPEAVFFNLNGHTYNGREHWTRLWQFYQKNVASSYWTPFEIGGVVSDGLAVLWCHRHTKYSVHYSSEIVCCPPAVCGSSIQAGPAATSPIAAQACGVALRD